jgi:hypothetical protein
VTLPLSYSRLKPALSYQPSAKPQRLKPLFTPDFIGTAKAAPFHNPSQTTLRISAAGSRFAHAR